MKTRINFTLKSLKGKRPVNQDSLACSFNDNNDFCAIVCDGVGSADGSEHASKLVTDIFTDSFQQTYTFNSPTIWFKDTLNRALKALKTLSIKLNKPGMSTTLALLIIANGKYYAYNIGDTRIYLINGSDIKQCSYDHNYRNYLISKGYKGDRLEALRDKWYSITSFIDANNPNSAKFECNSGEVQKGYKFIICTDGVYGYVDREKMVKIINKKTWLLPLKASSLNKEAINNDSHDNVSNIIITIK